MADAITTKNITSVDEVQSVDNTDKVFVNDNGEFKQVSISNLMKRAPSGVTEETDPTVSEWAKQPTKPSYTADEVGALPVGTKIPTKTSDLTNDSGYLTQIPEEYVTETELGQKGYVIEDDIPEKLPSPGTLTFTGAVNDTYDGSADKIINIPTGGGEGGTSDYNALANKPKLNGVEIAGNKTSADYKIVSSEQGIENNGKFLGVGVDGNVTPVDKPTYTADEVGARPDTWTPSAEDVGALPNNTEIPSKTSDLENDSGFITNSDIPEKLPNPQKIIFTGAVSAEYDGSSQQTINIPTDGGSEPYTLPIMSSTQLGGGKAVSKTDEDVPVAVDPSTGQLFVPTYPENTGGGGGSVNPEQIKQAVNGYLEENPVQPTPVDKTLTKDNEAADAKITGDAIKNNSEKIDSLSEEIVKKTTFIDEEKSEIKSYDCLANSTINNYLAYTIGMYFDELVGSTIYSLSVSAKTGTKVKFSAYSHVRKYPDNPANLTMIFTKIKDLGESTAEDNIATINGLDLKLLEGQVIIFSGNTKTLGYQKSVGNEYDVYAYSNDSYPLNIGENFEAVFTGSSETNRGAYKVEYMTPEEIVRKNISEVVKEMIDPVRDIPEIKEQIENISDDVAEIKESIENIGGAGGLKETFENRKPINKYFVLTVDDLTRDALTITKTLIDNNIYPAFGIRMDTVGSSITWDEIRELQSMGFEMAFHGMTHSDFPASSSPSKDDIMESQIKEFKELCEENDVYIKGYLGPNHYQLPVSCRREFEWARSAYGLDAYGGGGKFSDTFANVIVMSMEITSDSQDLSEFKSWSESVGDNQYLTPMCHTQNLVAQIDRYLELFKKWNNDGLICIRPCDAVRQSLWDCGSIGQNSTFDVQSGDASKPYFVIAKNGSIKTNHILE